MSHSDAPPEAIAVGVTPEAVRPDYYEDRQGRMIPARKVRASDLLEDQFVRGLMEKADALSAQMRAFKAAVFGDVDTFVALLHEKYEVKVGGKRGNMTFTSYDGRLQIKVQVTDHMRFGPELQVAKSLIDECIREWATETNDNIRVLVEHAFRTDKEGKVSRESVFALRRVEIADPRWERAMKAIADSVMIESTSRYVRFYRRDSQEAAWQPVSHDLANL